MQNTYDIAIIGSGLAGTFANLKIARENKNLKTIIFDIGRAPQKRRQFLIGYLGVLPNSDGKLYMNDISKVASLITNRKANSSFKWVEDYLSNINEFKVIKDRKPQVSVEKKIKKYGFNLTLNDYMQMYPKDIHALSRLLSNEIESAGNTKYCFDTEIIDISKQKGMFVVKSATEEYRCKRLLMAVGRSGWRWAKEIFQKFDIIENNDYAKFGVMVEMNVGHMKEYNHSNCTITKGDELTIGPMTWNGTIIHEDHVDLAITTLRSNENRWNSDKVAFSIIGSRYYPNKGSEQTDRLGKLTYLLSNDRISKEKVSTILSKKSQISVLHEYDWLVDSIKDMSNIIPELITKAYYYIPTIHPFTPTINIGKNLETEIEGMYTAGETAGINGLLSAAIMGVAAGDAICK